MQALRSWFGLLGTLALAGLPAPAGAQPVGSEFQINTYTTGVQSGGSVASDAMGNFVVVWTGGGDGDSDGVFGQRYDRAGRSLGAEFLVNSHTTNGQGGGRVASDASGNFVVVWTSLGQDGDGRGVFGQRFDSNGKRRGSEFRVSAYTTGEQYGASVASDSNGNFVVVWTTDYWDPYEDAYGKRYDSAGNPLGTEFRLSNHTFAYQIQPDVAFDADGNFVVVWRFEDYRYGAFGDHIFGQRFDSRGVRQGDEFRVNSDTTRSWDAPSVASHGSGDFVVVWERTGYLFGLEIYGRRFDSEGVPQGGAFHVNSDTGGYQFDASVAIDGSGSFIVTWSGEGADGYEDVLAQRYDIAGNRQGGEFRMNAYTPDRQQGGSVAAMGNEKFVVVWSSRGQDGDTWGVFGRRLDRSRTQTITVGSPEPRQPADPHGPPDPMDAQPRIERDVPDRAAPR